MSLSDFDDDLNDYPPEHLFIVSSAGVVPYNQVSCHIKTGICIKDRCSLYDSKTNGCLQGNYFRSTIKNSYNDEMEKLRNVLSEIYRHEKNNKK